MPPCKTNPPRTSLCFYERLRNTYASKGLGIGDMADLPEKRMLLLRTLGYRPHQGNIESLPDLGELEEEFITDLKIEAKNANQRIPTLR